MYKLKRLLKLSLVNFENLTILMKCNYNLKLVLRYYSSYKNITIGSQFHKEHEIFTPVLCCTFLRA